MYHYLALLTIVGLIDATADSGALHRSSISPAGFVASLEEAQAGEQERYGVRRQNERGGSELTVAPIAVEAGREVRRTREPYRGLQEGSTNSSDSVGIRTDRERLSSAVERMEAFAPVRRLTLASGIASFVELVPSGQFFAELVTNRKPSSHHPLRIIFKIAFCFMLIFIIWRHRVALLWAFSPALAGSRRNSRHAPATSEGEEDHSPRLGPQMSHRLSRRLRRSQSGSHVITDPSSPKRPPPHLKSISQEEVEANAALVEAAARTSQTKYKLKSEEPLPQWKLTPMQRNRPRPPDLTILTSTPPLQETTEPAESAPAEYSSPAMEVLRRVSTGMIEAASLAVATVSAEIATPMEAPAQPESSGFGTSDEDVSGGSGEDAVIVSLSQTLRNNQASAEALDALKNMSSQQRSSLESKMGDSVDWANLPARSSEAGGTTRMEPEDTHPPPRDQDLAAADKSGRLSTLGTMSTEVAEAATKRATLLQTAVVAEAALATEARLSLAGQADDADDESQF